MKKRIIKGCAWALALVTAVSLLAVRQDTAYGAGAVNPDATPRGIQFDLADNAGKTYQEVMSLTIPVHYYKIADMNVPTGTYKGSLKGKWTELNNVAYKVVADEDKASGFEIKVEGVDDDYATCDDKDGKARTASLEYVDRDADATYAWEALAKRAESLLEDSDIGGTAEVVNGHGAVNLGNDSLGMYLIVAGDVDSRNYTYSFKPNLISVPSNAYVPDAAGVLPDNDDWIYEVTMGLKPEQKERYASLEITKTLSDFNATLGNAMFVFDVTAVNSDGETVYNDVVELNFDGPGAKSVRIGPEAKDGVDVVGKIPAGSNVTVTERYSGSAYEAVGNAVQLVSNISAEGEGSAEEEDSDEPSASVDFTNRYNGSVNGGAGVVNHFESSEGRWNDNAVQQFVPERTEGGNP